MKQLDAEVRALMVQSSDRRITCNGASAMTVRTSSRGRLNLCSEVIGDRGSTAFVTDALSGRVMRWPTVDRMPADLPSGALEMALWTHDRAGQAVIGVIQHSDTGDGRTGLRYSERRADVGAGASMGIVGVSYDYAPAETVVGFYKTEPVTIDGLAGLPRQPRWPAKQSLTR